MHSERDQSVLALCLMYSPFEVFLPKTESVKQKFIYSCFCGSTSSVQSTDPLIKKDKNKKKTRVFHLCCCIVNTRPGAYSLLVQRTWAKAMNKEKFGSQSYSYGASLNPDDRSYVNLLFKAALMDSHTPRKESLTDRDWQIRNNIVVAVLKGPTPKHKRCD